MDSKKKIVICEDDNWTRESVKDFITDMGYLVFDFDNGQKALNYIKGNVVDLIVSDIQMPYMSGVELIEQLNVLNLRIPLIFLTGVINPIDVLKTFSYNYFEYINKPIRPAELKSSIEKALVNGYQEPMFSNEFLKRIRNT